MFKCMPPIFRGSSRRVERVDRSHSNLVAVPEEIARYKSLEQLALNSNHIRELPKYLFRLQKLRVFTASDNEIQEIPQDIGAWQLLQELNLSKNDISNIPEGLRHLRNLQLLDLSQNCLYHTPDFLVDLKNLNALYLNDVALVALPVAFGMLASLRTLELRDNNLKTLPDSFGQLRHLERLDLGGNEFEDLSPVIGRLESLEELWLDCNSLSRLPGEIGKLLRLKCLDVSENRLEALPAELCHLSSLSDLLLSQNLLKKLPKDVGKLKKLTILKLDQNQISHIPDSLGNCESLQELILTDNELTQVPPDIGSLSKLTNLNIDRNLLQRLPPDIGKLEKLTMLSLRENRLSDFPLEIGNLSSLHVMDISGNRLKNLPISMASLRLKALWLAENQSQPLLKFQQDVDESTGEKVLTCFLLPQQEYNVDDASLDPSVITNNNLKSPAEDQPQRESMVKFFDSNPESTKTTQFVRHDTPHPKELRARHQKYISKVREGNAASIESNDDETMNHRENNNSDNESFKDAQSTFDQQCREKEDSGSEFADERPQRCLRSGPTQKHVGFTGDVDSSPEEHPDKDVLKLHRRDTPHHLKNKRVFSQSKGTSTRMEEDLKDKVASILAREQAAQQNNGDESSDRHKPESPNQHTPQRGDGGFAFQNAAFNDSLGAGVEMHELRVRRSAQSLGLSIAGGRNSTPFRADDEGIFISKVTPGGPAEHAGLRVGDKVLMVNENSLVGVDHNEAVDILKRAGALLNLRVERVLPGLSEWRSETTSVMEETFESVVSVSSTQVQQLRPTTGPPLERVEDRVDRASEVDRHHLERHMVREYTRSPHLNRTYSESTTETAAPEWRSAEERLNLTQEIASPRPTAYEIHVEHRKEKGEKPVQERPTAAPRTRSEPSTPVLGVGRDTPTMEKSDIIFTTLIRDRNSLGFDVEEQPMRGYIVSSISKGGSAWRDGKLREGDRVVSINGVDVDGLDLEAVRRRLTGLDRFVRVVVERLELVDPNCSANTSGVYSASSYMANRPSYLGSYRKRAPLITQSSLGNSTALNTSFGGSSTASLPKLPGLRNWQTDSSISTAPGALSPTKAIVTTMNNGKPPIPPKPNILVSVGHKSKELSTEFPASPRTLGKTTEVITHTTLTETTMTRVTNNVPADLAIENGTNEDVTLTKESPSQSLGLSIVGGCDHFCHPFGTGEGGVYVSKIVSSSLAAQCGRLRVGDRLEKVNGVSVQDLSHQEVVQLMVQSGLNLVLHVHHEALPKGWQEITLNRKAGEKLGMNIKGGTGVNGSCGNPFDPQDESVFVSKVSTEGAVHRDNRIKVGMRIVEVNGQPLLGASHEEAVATIKSAGSTITFVVCDGYNNIPGAALQCQDISNDLSAVPSGGEQVQHKVIEVLKAAGRLVDANASEDTDKPLDKSTDSALGSKTTTVFMSRKSVVKPDEAPRDATATVDSEELRAEHAEHVHLSSSSSGSESKSDDSPSETSDGEDSDDQSRDSMNSQIRARTPSQRDGENTKGESEA